MPSRPVKSVPISRWQIVAAIALLAAISVWALLRAHGETPSSQFALKGTLVTPTEIIEDGTILVVGEKIKAVGKEIQIPTGVKVIETGAFIYPGLIDLHDHITWNFLPRWTPGQKFSNRYEWQQLPEYLPALSSPHGQVVPSPSPPGKRTSKQEELACDANRYGEVKAIAGGATSVVDSLGIDKDNPCIEGMARNLNSYSGLYPSGTEERLRNEVFPLEIRTDDVIKINDALAHHQLALVVHLAEGKRNDASSAREFRMLRARGFLQEGLSIIHGVALRGPDFDEMKTAGVGLIWSPRSNVELYGETTDVRTANDFQIMIALAPDWSPTGSDGMLEELNYAAAWNAAQSPRVFTDAELVNMVTLNPAKLARSQDKIGSLKPDHFADLLVVHSKEKDGYRALLHSRPVDIGLVIIGGSPVYGDAELMQQLAAPDRLEPLMLCSTTKFIDFDTEKVPEGKQQRKSWKATVEALTEELKPWHLSPSDLTPCPP